MTLAQASPHFRLGVQRYFGTLSLQARLSHGLCSTAYVGPRATQRCIGAQNSTCSSTRNFSVIPGLQNDAVASFSSASAKPTSSSVTNALTWNEFFRLRQRRRYLNVFSSAITSTTSLLTGVAVLSTQNPESLNLFGMDPMIIMALVSVGCLAGGWLMGPVIGGGLFKMLIARGQRGREFGEKERNFFERIRRYRIDPTSSSIQNPVPDYYGEKITSVTGYRGWLKDQRAFNKKRQSFL